MRIGIVANFVLASLIRIRNIKFAIRQACDRRGWRRIPTGYILPLLLLSIALAVANFAVAGTIVDNPGSNMFQTGTISQFKLTDFENVLDPNGNVIPPGATIVPGDTFQGMYLVTNSQTTGGANILLPGDFQLAGVFQLLVQSTTANIGSTGQSAFTLVPYAPFAAQYNLPAGAMLALWDGPANTFNAAAPTWQQAEATATAGTLWEVGGAAPGSVWGNNYYWAAVGSANPGVAAFSTSLQMLANFTGVPSGFFANLQQQPPAGFGPTAETNSLFAIGNPIALQGNTSLNTSPDVPFQITSQDPLEENVVPVPEPSTAALLGAISLALALLGVKRRNRLG